MSLITDEQELLKDEGLYDGAIDGQWGPLTQAAFELHLKKEGQPVPPWIPVAARELGISEIAGSRANKRILEYHGHTTLGAESDEISWCSSFVNFVTDQCLIDGTNSAAARSWLQWGRSVGTRPGAIVVFWRVAPSSWQGHVAFGLKWSDSRVLVLGGNQSNKVCVAEYPRSQVLDYRWPTINQLQDANLRLG